MVTTMATTDTPTEVSEEAPVEESVEMTATTSTGRQVDGCPTLYEQIGQMMSAEN